MIEVSNLSKRYAATHAIRDLCFSIKKGEVVGFLGPNGAGKSTTLNILTGYLSPTIGSVQIDGMDIMDNPVETKARIGYLPETPPLYQDMTVKEYLNFMYELKRVTLPRQSHIEEICNLVKISKDVYKRVISHLSKGYKQRVGIAQALLGNPPVLILDEPTVGLDPKQMIEIRKLIEQLGKNRTVILSSHILSEIQAVCNRIIIIHQGQIVADGTPETITTSIDGGNVISARIAGSPTEIIKALRNVKMVRSVTDMGEKERGAHDYHIEVQPAIDARYAIFDQLASRKLPILNLRAGNMSLEDVFLRLTSYSPEIPAEEEPKGGTSK